MRESSATWLVPHVVAAVLTAMLLLLGARLLLWTPRPGPATAVDPAQRLQVRFVERAQPAPPPAPQRNAPAASAAAGEQATGTVSPAGPSRPAAADRAQDPARRAGLPAPASVVLYDAEGRVRLPPEALADERLPARSGSDLLERSNPVDYRGTRFEGEWASDGDIADLAGQAIARGQRKVAELLLGKDIQHAEARPPPQVRFNPGLHERPQDLGSEATGDAWRAAPISAEPVPGLDGRASRDIREQVAQLERDFARCPRDRLEERMVPVRQALEALQAVEHALAKGADPIRARHQLPNAANSAWDQARRGLWHARRTLSDCGG